MISLKALFILYIVGLFELVILLLKPPTLISRDCSMFLAGMVTVCVLEIGAMLVKKQWPFTKNKKEEKKV